MAANPQSILDTVKKVLGFDPDYTAFDIDIIMLINSAFGDLQQIGVGSDTGFSIEDNTTLWTQYVQQMRILSMVKTYVFMVVKLAFDPPGTSFGLDAIKSQIDKLSFRINVAAEQENPPTDPFGEDSEPYPWGQMATFFAPKVVLVDYAPEIALDASAGNVFVLGLTGDCVLNSPLNGTTGEHITLQLTSNGHTVTWGNGWDFGDKGAPSLSSGGKTDIISAYYEETSARWFAGFTSGF